MASILTTWDPSKAIGLSITSNNLTISSNITSAPVQNLVLDLTTIADSLVQFSVILNSTGSPTVTQGIGLTTDIEDSYLGATASFGFYSDGSFLIYGVPTSNAISNFGDPGDVLTLILDTVNYLAYIDINDNGISNSFDVSTVFGLTYSNLYFAYQPSDAVTFSLSSYINNGQTGYIDVLALEPMVPVYTTGNPEDITLGGFVTTDNITIYGTDGQYVRLLNSFGSTNGYCYFSLKIVSNSDDRNGFQIGVVNGTQAATGDLTQTGTACFQSQGYAYRNGGQIDFTFSNFGTNGDIVTFLMNCHSGYMNININNTGWHHTGLYIKDLVSATNYTTFAFTMSRISEVQILDVINSPLTGCTPFLGSLPNNFTTSFENLENGTVINDNNTVILNGLQKIAGYIPISSRYVFSFLVITSGGRLDTGIMYEQNNIESRISYLGVYTDIYGSVTPNPTYTFGEVGDIVTVAIDNENQLIWWDVNHGGWTNNGNPATSEGGISTSIQTFDIVQFFVRGISPVINLQSHINVPITGYTNVIATQSIFSIILTVDTITQKTVNFSWIPVTTDSYSIILNSLVIESGFKGNSWSITTLTPSISYSLQIYNSTANTYSNIVRFRTLNVPQPVLSIDNVTTNQVYFSWVGFNDDTYNVLLDGYTIQSGLTSNASSISYLSPNTNHTLQIFDTSYSLFSSLLTFTTSPLSPPNRLITSTTDEHFVIPASILPPLTLYTRMVAVENMRIVYKTSANPIESFVVRSRELDQDVITFPYKSAITNYSDNIASNTIGLSIVEPYTYPNITLELYYISSIDGQRYSVTGTYQCTGSFVLYNYQA